MKKKYIYIVILVLILLSLVLLYIDKITYKEYSKNYFYMDTYINIKTVSEEEYLNMEVEKLKDPDYVARYAREQFLYSKDGEFNIRIK